MSGAYELPLDYVLWAILRVKFETQGKEVTDYAVMLLYEIEGRTETIASMTAPTAKTRCTATPAARASSRERPCIAVPLETECGLRSQRSRAATAR
jgi:hypothetical protein